MQMFADVVKQLLPVSQSHILKVFVTLCETEASSLTMR